MKAVDVINKLKDVLPRYSGLFSDELDVVTLSHFSGVVTCTCGGDHGLSIGDDIHINGALTPITINSISRVGDLATAVTNSNHDLTRGYQQTVTLTGANQSQYNGEHNLIDVFNRRTFVFSVTGSPTTPATGTIKMLENINAGYNGLHSVLGVIDSKTFTYAITSAPESQAQGTIKVRKELTITGDVTIERFLESYTKQPTNKLYAVVVLGGTTSSKDRFTFSDATSTSTNNNVDLRQRIIDPFSIYMVVPTSSTLTAMTARDGMEDVWSLLNKSILFNVFTTGSSAETNLGVSFVGHGMRSYDYAYYIHEFRYEFVFDLVRDDGINNDTSVAFRDIDLHFNSYLNPGHDEIMHTLVDLDDKPLP